MARDPQQPGEGKPHESAGSGEFTQMFGALQPPVAAADPFLQPSLASTAGPAPQQPAHGASADGGFTALFATLDTRGPETPAADAPAAPPLPAAQTPPQAFAAAPAPAQVPPKHFANPDSWNAGRPGGGIFSETSPTSAEAPTQIFGKAPALGVTASPELEETRIDSASAPRSQPAPLPPLPVASATPAGSPFTPAGSPLTPPAGTPPPPPAAGEFTQVFRPMAPPPTRPAPPVAAPASAPPPGEFTQFFSAVSEKDAAAKVRSPAPTPVPSPARSQPQPPPKAAPGIAAEPGAFTQMFAQLSPAAAAQSPSQSLKPSAAFPPPPATQPIFGATAPQGTFTDGFAGAGNAPQHGEPQGGLTELFRAPSSGSAAFPPASGSPFPGGPATPFPEVQRPAGGATLPTPFPAPTHPAQASAAAQGDFTRLMQSLDGPGQRPNTPVAVPALPIDAAFFSPSPSGTSGEGEYTRVMRGGAAAQPLSGSAGAPAAGTAASPGLSLAPAAPVGKAEEKPAKEKPRSFVILLVVLNVVLLVALALLGVYLLRHK